MWELPSIFLAEEVMHEALTHWAEFATSINEETPAGSLNSIEDKSQNVLLPLKGSGTFLDF